MGTSRRIKSSAARAGTKQWKGLHVGHVQCHREKERHAKWRWGMKKGLRRARRRLGKQIVEAERNGE